MLRSMYAGVSGMNNFQTKLDVIGNNIANVNTFGYKKSRVTFQDMMSQKLAGANAPTLGDDGTGIQVPLKGGTNPKQVGLGSMIGSLDTIHTQGSLQTTNRPLDLAISGDGFFTVAKGGPNAFFDSETKVLTDATQVDYSFTRSGNFYIDSEGYIVDGNGLYLIGNPYDELGGMMWDQFGRIKIDESAQSFSISSDGTITYIDQDEQTKIAGEIRLAKFSNPSGLEKAGGNLYKDTMNSGTVDLDGSTIAFDSIDDLARPGQKGTGELLSGALEMSNVDLAEEFTEMIVAQRGFQANTKIITTSDQILQELVNLKR